MKYIIIYFIIFSKIFYHLKKITKILILWGYITLHRVSVKYITLLYIRTYMMYQIVIYVSVVYITLHDIYIRTLIDISEARDDEECIRDQYDNWCYL